MLPDETNLKVLHLNAIEVGTLSNTKTTIDVKAMIPNYQNLTTDNFYKIYISRCKNAIHRCIRDDFCHCQHNVKL